MTDEHDIESAVQAARIAGFLPQLAQMVDKLEHGVEMRMKVALENGKLTPDMALSGWIEKLAYKRILTRTKQQAQFIEENAPQEVVTLHVPNYVTPDTI